MRRVLFILPTVLFSTLPGRGQDSYPKRELFGGYAFSRYTDGIGSNLNGWGASVTGYFTKNIGLTSDITGVYGSEPYFYACTRPIPPGCPAATQSLGTYYFLAGPRFTMRTRKAAPFAEALFGAASHYGQRTGNWSTFAMGFGGGLDVPLNDHFAFRVFQADYIPARQAFGLSGWNSNLRVQTGLVFTFGRRKR